MTRDARVWLIGEQNPYGADPKYALYPTPRHSAGGRLCALLDNGLGWYVNGFVRRNLLASARWSVPDARQSALRILDESGAAPLVLLGRRVCDAFGVQFEPCETQTLWRGLLHEGERTLLPVPHPSGLNRMWNDPDMHRRVRDAILQLRAKYDAAP